MRQGKEQNFLINQKENPKRTIGKLPKGIHEVGKGSWKEREVGKSEMKLERSKLESSGRSWKARTEVGKFKFNLESEHGENSSSIYFFPTSDFPTTLSNYTYPYQNID